MRARRAVEQFYDVAHVLLVGDLLRDFRGIRDQIAKMPGKLSEQLDPGIGIKLIAPNQGLKGDMRDFGIQLLAQTRSRRLQTPITLFRMCSSQAVH